MLCRYTSGSCIGGLGGLEGGGVTGSTTGGVAGTGGTSFDGKSN